MTPSDRSRRSSSWRPLRAVATVSDEASDEELLIRLARGDQAAFTRLYDRLGAVVFGVVRQVVRDPAQSEEVAQEVFVEVWRRASTFDTTRGTARTWIVTVAHRRAIDRVRSEQASRDRTERVGRRAYQPDYDVVQEEVEVHLEHERIRAALAGLTDLQRQAVELAYFGGYTYREVAELLDTPLGTIKTRMRDGLIRLRDAMGVTP